MNLTNTTCPVADAIADAERAVRVARDAATEKAIAVEDAPGVENLFGEVRELSCELARAAERYDRETTGMVEGEEWEPGDVYTESSESWGVTVVVRSERDPVLEVDAPDAHEAGKRAATRATLEMGLPEAIVIDGAWHRRRGGGTRKVSPGRYQVTIEGW